jgi:hypothetical protein
MASFSSVTYGARALFHNFFGTNRFIRPLNDPMLNAIGQTEPRLTCGSGGHHQNSIGKNLKGQQTLPRCAFEVTDI